MSDVIFMLVIVAAMIGASIVSANRKKKQASGQATYPRPVKPPIFPTTPKSLGEILEELARGEGYGASEEEIDVTDADYSREDMARLAEEEESAAARLVTMTYTPMTRDSVERNTKKIVEESSAASSERREGEPADDSIEEILADFDLRRAVIESEILHPKFQEY
jgi:hypothetical protein